MRNLTLLIALFLTVNIYAQWTTDTDVNTLVAETESGDMKAIGTSEGETYVVFWKSVEAPVNYELRLQLLDVTGNRLLGDDGLLISNAIPMGSFTVTWSVAVDSEDNLLVGVTGTADDTGRVFKLDTEGNHLWGADGVTISGIAFNVTLLPLTSGEALVSWVTGVNAKMQKFDVNGTAVWDDPQEVISGSSKTAPGNMFELSNDDYLMVFHSYNWGISSTLYAQKYNSEGIAQWASPTQLSNKTTTHISYYSGTQDGDTVYFGYKGSHSNRFDSYLQRINPDGTLPWGINGMDFDVNETDYEMDTRIAFSSGSQYVWSMCTYTDPNQTDHGEYIQKFDKGTGARQLTDNAKAVYAISSDDKVHASDLFLVDDQPFFLLKSGTDNGVTPTTLDVLLLDSNGDFAWPEEVKPMATYEANKSRTHLTRTVNNQSVAVFIEDKSEGSKMYAQNFIHETEDLGKIQGFVRDAETNLSIDGALITAVRSDNEVYTVETPFGSHYHMMLPAGTYNITCASSGYETSTVTDVVIVADENTNLTFYLEPVKIITGIYDANDQQINIWPNPASSEVNIQFNDEISRLLMFNHSGQLVYETNTISNTLNLNVSEFESGIYFIKVFSRDNVITRKLVIE